MPVDGPAAAPGDVLAWRARDGLTAWGHSLQRFQLLVGGTPAQGDGNPCVRVWVPGMICFLCTTAVVVVPLMTSRRREEPALPWLRDLSAWPGGRPRGGTP